MVRLDGQEGTLEDNLINDFRKKKCLKYYWYSKGLLVMSEAAKDTWG